LLLVIATCVEPAVAYSASSSAPPQDQSAAPKKAKKEKKSKKASQDKDSQDSPASPNASGAAAGDSAAEDSELVEVTADRQSKEGDLAIYEGYVNALQGDYRLQADKISLNTVTGDMIADGNVIFDQGPDQRVTAKRAEINWKSHLGTFWDTTGFTNRTQTGDYIFYTAARVEKTGEDTYEMYDAVVTACEDVIPKWTFRARRAELKMGDRLILHNAVFRVKTLPTFALPYAWIPATRNERKSRVER
jgi:LPS-assembly protein